MYIKDQKPFEEKEATIIPTTAIPASSVKPTNTQPLKSSLPQLTNQNKHPLKKPIQNTLQGNLKTPSRGLADSSILKSSSSSNLRPTPPKLNSPTNKPMSSLHGVNVGDLALKLKGMPLKPRELLLSLKASKID